MWRDGRSRTAITVSSSRRGIFFGVKVSDGFVVAGGAALLASDLIVRATQDIDLDVLAQMMRRIVRFDDDEIPLEPDLVPSAREFFESWSVELSNR